MDNFERELASLLNMYSKDNDCNIPDFVLARMIAAMLEPLSMHVEMTRPETVQIESAEKAVK